MYIQRQGKTTEDILRPGTNVQVLQELRKETLKNALSKTLKTIQRVFGHMYVSKQSQGLRCVI